MKRLLFALTLCIVSSSAFAITTPFTMPWVNQGTAGANYTTSDHAHAVFVLEFFENFCGACNENADNVNAMAADYASNPLVQVLDVTLDTSTREMQQWLARHRPNHPMVQDAGQSVWHQIHSQYIPTTVVMDCMGNELFKAVGAWDDSEKQRIRYAVTQGLAACR